MPKKPYAPASLPQAFFKTVVERLRQHFGEGDKMLGEACPGVYLLRIFGSRARALEFKSCGLGISEALNPKP